MFVIVALLSFLADQYTKYLVSCNMTENQTIALFPGIFDLTYVRNTGAAFGMLSDKQTLIAIVTSVMLAALSVYAVRERKKIPKLESLALALIVGGGLGNLVTRLLYRYVIDFFNFYFWPVFNVSDICICVGCALLILSVLVLEPKKMKKEGKNS